MILTRISSKKFATLFIEKLKLANPPKACSESISNEISTKSNFSNDEDAVNSLHSATISEMGTFTIRRSLILDENKFFLETGRKWTQHIYDSVGRIIKCSIQIKKKTIPPITDLIKIEAYCRFEKCSARYTIQTENVSGENLIFSVFLHSEIVETAHDHRKRRNISGQMREKTAIETLQFGSKYVMTKQITSQDLSKNNFDSETTCQTLGALRQIKYQKMGFSDMDKDDRLDVLALKELTDNEPKTPNNPCPKYIRYIRADELSVFWMCDMQIDCFLQNKARIVSLDATGNVTKSKGSTKRQFYYSMVYRSEISNEIVPLSEFISSSHDINNLSTLLSICSRELKKSTGQSNSIDVIVIDFSFALINSASLAFNQCNLFCYLQLWYQKFVKNELENINLTIIASCSVHVIKFFSDKIQPADKEKKNTTLLSFAKLITAQTYDEYLQLCSSFYLALSKSVVSSQILLNILPNAISKNIIDEFGSKDTEILTASPLEEILKPKNSIYRNTYFAIDIKNKITEMSYNTTNMVSSSLFNPELANYFVKRLAPFGILWSSFAHKRESNSLVENHFKVAKNDILKTVNAKPGRVIKELRVFALSKIIPIYTSKLFKTKVQKKQTICKKDDPVEEFKKTKAPKLTYFDKINMDSTQRLTRSFMPNSLDKKVNMKAILIENAKFDLEYDHKYFEKFIGKIKLSKSDIKTLENKEWLNDSIIDANITLVINNKDNQALVDTFIVQKLIETPYEILETSSWLKSMNYLRTKEIIFFPINLNSIHWALATYSSKEKSLTYYDSLFWDGSLAMKNLSKILQKILHQNTEISTNICKVPRQPNGYDCGVYLLMNIRFLSSNYEIMQNSYTIDDIKIFREILKNESINGKILVDL